VRDWWLPDVGMLLPLAVLQEALDRLVSRGFVSARAVPGGVVYGRSRHGGHE